MDNTIEKIGLITQAGTSVRIVLVTMAVCCLVYPAVILGLGQTLTPYSANGSLVIDDRGQIVGSERLAQRFDRPEYLWPRPSAVDYNAAASGGSNWSPAHPALRKRAMALLARFNAASDRPVPVDLVTASGSGLDPDITLAAARYQAGRVAAARSLPAEAVVALVDRYAWRPGGALTPQPLVNVLLVNVALDRLGK